MNAKLQLQRELKSIRRRVLLLTLTFFTLLEVMLFMNSKNQGRERAQNWIERNGASIAQAIFLENLHAVSGLLERSVADTENSSLDVSILDLNGQPILENSEAKSGPSGIPYHLIRERLFDFRVESPIYFDQSQVGTLVITGHQSLLSMLQHTFILVVSIMLFYIATNRLLDRFHRVVWRKILTPLTNLTIHMRVQSSLGSVPPEPPTETIDEVRELYSNFSALSARTLASEAQLLELETAKAVTQIARQVAHDIRSPVSALNMVASLTEQMPEASRQLIRKATQRINDIANHLLAQSRCQAPALALTHDRPATSSPQSVVMLVAVLDELLSEMRLQHKSSRIEIKGELESGYGLFVEVNSSELCRSISNLVNNSVEAMPNDRPICITLKLLKEGVHAVIEVQDNGKGIPGDQLKRIGERDFSFGKSTSNGSGNGLGLSQVFGFAKGVKGSVEISSELNQGTTVRLKLPLCTAPGWFVPSLDLSDFDRIVSIDDDESIHEIWDRRIVGAGLSETIERLRLHKPEMNPSIAGEGDTRSLFLVDFEFSDHQLNGLQLIESEGLRDCALLVTSRYDDTLIQKKAEQLNVKILPKNLAYLIPIRSVRLIREQAFHVAHPTI